jgi:hypothetical protein
MLRRKQYIFPVPEIDGMKAVEVKYLELLGRRRQEKLDDEEEDFLSWANNVLMTVE